MRVMLLRYYIEHWFN